MADEKNVATRWVVIPASDAPLQTFTAELPDSPSLKALHEIIDPLLNGGDLEHVNVLAAFDPGAEVQHLDMFVDEIGIVKGLPRNDRATVIYRQATMLGRTGIPAPVDPETLDFIAGTAVLFDRRVWK
jgi:hypothetical protein